METAKFDRNTITIESEDGKTICKSSGSVLKFDGFLKVYSNQSKDDDEQILPEMSKGPINIEALIDEQHFTQPPPRYSEASLVKKLEELGIGRPSTYASIISTIANRGYAEIVSKRFFPTDRGKLISAFLEKLFSKYVDYNFTAGLEDQLDEITSGKESWLKVLEMFWKDFNSNVSEVKEKRTREVLDLLNESLGALIFDTDKEGKIVRKCQLCDTGSLSLKNSFRGGAFIGCSNYPECKFTRPLSKAKAAAQSQLAEPKFLGKHENGNDIFLKNGRFGPYLQYEKVLEENIEEEKPKKRKKTKKKKPEVNELLKNVSIPKGIELESIDLDKAKFLCSLPKSLGVNPDNQKEITLNTGRFGPYLKCENKSARIENVDEIFDAICPLLPIPETIILPLVLYRSSTASLKLFDKFFFKSSKLLISISITSMPVLRFIIFINVKKYRYLSNPIDLIQLSFVKKKIFFLKFLNDLLVLAFHEVFFLNQIKK